MMVRIFLILSCAAFIFSCQTSYKLKDGAEAFELKQYHMAISMLKKELEGTKRLEERSKKMYMVGRSYQELLDYQQALEWFSQAERSNFGYEATLQKAYTLKNLMRYKEATLHFESLKSVPTLIQEVTAQAQACQISQRERDGSPKNIVVEDLLDLDVYSDYAAVIYDYDYLVFTSDREETTGKDKYNWTGRKFSDLFIADKESKTVQRFDAVINSDDNEGTPAFSRNFDLCVFSRCFSSEEGNANCKLMSTTRIDGIWGEPYVLPFVKPGINYSQPCFFENDSVLIFSAPGETKDKGFDLWYTERDNGNWSEPYPLPSSINSGYNEHFPTADGDTLYFASDLPGGFGGLDMYKTWVSKDGSWAKPIRLPFPFNSGGDDFSLVVDRWAPKTRNILQQGYFSSSRNSEGHDKLYQFKVLVPSEDKKEEVPIVENTENKEIYLALKVVQSNKDNSNKRKAALPQTKIFLTNEILLTDKNGLVLHQLESDKVYNLKIEKDSFLTKSISITTKDIKFNPGENIITINKEVELDKIEPGKEIILENIYYEYDQWNIREDARPSLDRLAELLLQNPTIRIELGSHTDCRGDDVYNEELSAKRAQSVVNYLIGKGIAELRLVARGYGETTPFNPCVCDQCTEEMHQQNRRTSFKII